MAINNFTDMGLMINNKLHLLNITAKFNNDKLELNSEEMAGDNANE